MNISLKNKGGSMLKFINRIIDGCLLSAAGIFVALYLIKTCGLKDSGKMLELLSNFIRTKQAEFESFREKEKPFKVHKGGKHDRENGNG